MSQPPVLVLPGQTVPSAALAALGPYTKRGSTANFDVYYDNSLGTNGQNLADAVLAKCEQDFAQLRAWFGGINAGRFPVYIDPGSFGAYHATCLATEIHCAAFSETNGDLVNMVNVAEVDEVLMAVQKAGWDCGGSNGEGLSRVLATERYPAQLNGFATAPLWLDGTDATGHTRPDYVSVTDPTAGLSGGDLNHVGCATLFINYLRFQLGFNLYLIVQAAGTTLAQTYRNLTGRADAFGPFAGLLQQRFPPGTPSGLANDNPWPFAQDNWGWCNKCQGMAFAGNASLGPCPAGGQHDHSGSGNYALVQNSPGAAGQDNWRWCNKCQGMAFAGNASLGPCPAGGQHNHSGSGNYALVQNTPGFPGQDNWRWCNKCQGMAFAGNASLGPCPAGGQHDHSGSGNYVLVQVPRIPSQDNWRWCDKCQGLAFAGNASLGPCPAGGQHNHSGSGNYVLVQNQSGFPGQDNWRWCNKCQGMAFAGNASLGPCPAGGQHNHSGSGNYVLVQS